MSTPDRPQDSQQSAKAAKPEAAPRLTLLLVATVIGAIVALSFGHGVNIYGYRMEQSMVEYRGNPEQFEKRGTNLTIASGVDWLGYKLDPESDEELKQEIENDEARFFTGFRDFTPEHLTLDHNVDRIMHPTTDGRCEGIFLDNEAVLPDTEEPNSDKRCHYTIDWDDYFTWDITKPEEKEDWTDK